MKNELTTLKFQEKDLPQLGVAVRSTTLHRFWTMLAHFHGQLWNASEFARSFAGADLDLLIVRGRARMGFEIKLTGSPKTTRSIHSAISDLKLQHLDVVHAGDQNFPLKENIRAVSLHRILADLKSMN